MPITPDLPFPKSAGDAIRSKDWNDLTTETQRLDTAKLDRAGDTITGTLTVDGALGVGTGGAAPAAKLQVSGGAIMPSVGNTNASGIQFPLNPVSGVGDAAWLRYYARAGEAMTLELGISNEVDDHIALMPSGNVGIGTLAPGAKLDVNGNATIRNGLRVIGHIVATGAVFFNSLLGRVVDATAQTLAPGTTADLANVGMTINLPTAARVRISLAINQLTNTFPFFGNTVSFQIRLSTGAVVVIGSVNVNGTLSNLQFTADVDLGAGTTTLQAQWVSLAAPFPTTSVGPRTLSVTLI